ncbi:hypothetical protein DFH27DRAFT_537191 [Peziza echinospora]|nr:hypothetical protein DFH27DRAFT_537191 [Peziza echinospora]
MGWLSFFFFIFFLYFLGVPLKFEFCLFFALCYFGKREISGTGFFWPVQLGFFFGLRFFC